jgi:glyoxylase-like metal-dependent hydrolase (beta-lactamase superfamily II)
MPVAGVGSPDAPFPVTFGGFLVQTPDTTALFDCGLGPRARSMSPGIREGGNLLRRLEEAGVAPGEVDRVVISHLHIDHCGHLLRPDGSLTFGSAEVWLHRREAEYWRSASAAGNIEPALIRSYLETLESAGVLRTYADEFDLSPGVRLIPSPGHTPGHTAMLLSSAGAHAMLLGDVVHHTAHVTHPHWLQNYDVAPKTSLATRLDLFDRAARLGAVVTAVHMPILTLGTVTTTESGGHVYRPVRPNRTGGTP